MSINKNIIISLILAGLFSLFADVQSAKAGPLMDWLRGIRERRQAYANARYNRIPSANRFGNRFSGNGFANTGQTNVAGANQVMGAPVPGTCYRTCTRVVAQYVPYTAYRTCYQQVPVTTYRQSNSYDPCTGCQVTCMRPCTTYQQQARRVPYTAYRTVYRTVTMRTPVADCNTGTCNTCNTCSPNPGQGYYNNGYTSMQTPSYAPTYGSAVPANQSFVGQGYATQNFQTPSVPSTIISPYDGTVSGSGVANGYGSTQIQNGPTIAAPTINDNTIPSYGTTGGTASSAPSLPNQFENTPNATFTEQSLKPIPEAEPMSLQGPTQGSDQGHSASHRPFNRREITPYTLSDEDRHITPPRGVRLRGQQELDDLSNDFTAHRSENEGWK